MTKKNNALSYHKETVVKNSKIFSILFLEIILGSFFVVSLIVIFLKLHDEVFEKEFTQFDVGILHFLYDYRNPILNSFMIFITDFGADIMLALWVILIISLIYKKYFREGVLLGFVLSMTAFINFMLKLLIQRPRPQFHPLIIENGFSFPSGHAMDSFVFYMTLVYLLYHLTKKKLLTIIAGILASVLVLTIGISRVYLGVHYPTDIIAGYTAGLCWMLIVFLIHRSIIYLRLFKKNRLVSL